MGDVASAAGGAQESRKAALEAMRATLLRVAAASFGRGFDWLVLNGLPQLLLLYPDPLQRSPGRIDLLLAPDQASSVAKSLAASGFKLLRKVEGSGDLGRLGLRADPRTTVRDVESGLRLHLHERLFFADRKIAPLLHSYRPRRSRSPDDICAPPLGAPMALDVLLRGNARRWAERRWLQDLSAILERLDADAQDELLRSIAEAQFEPAALASLATLRATLGVEPPGKLGAWLNGTEHRAEIIVRTEMHAAASGDLPGGPIPSVRGAEAPQQRPSLWARLRGRIPSRVRRSGQFTRDPATRRDRYPLAFQFARRWLGDRDDLRILSFGCSSGEEVLTLCSYFPNAAIRGIDIEPRRIAQARTVAIGRAGVTFEVAGTAAHEPDGVYDAIFCMAVFRDPALDLPGASRAAGALTFDAFDREVSELVRSLKPGGLLLVAHSNFRICDTRAAAQLELVLHADPAGSGLTPALYGPTGSRLQNAVDRSLGFAKRPR